MSKNIAFDVDDHYRQKPFNLRCLKIFIFKWLKVKKPWAANYLVHYEFPTLCSFSLSLLGLVFCYFQFETALLIKYRMKHSNKNVVTKNASFIVLTLQLRCFPALYPNLFSPGNCYSEKYRLQSGQKPNSGLE